MERISDMTPTPCPDEDTYARFLQGILPPEQIADIERHIDACLRCAELGAQFGKLYGAAAPDADEPTAAGQPAGALLLAELATAAIHAVAAIAVLPAALRLIATRAASALAVAAAAYASVWVPPRLGCSRRSPRGRCGAGGRGASRSRAPTPSPASRRSC